MYYRLYDTQTGRHMATGYNTTSEKQLCDHYLSYKSADWEDDAEAYYKSLSVSQLIDMIRSDEFEIETSETPFERETE